MKKKLDTRFPAARIKKIMQSDEEVGKIALATPVLISKSLELFLQDLCNKTYEITLARGAKTISGVHLRQCVSMNSEYDFLREIVNKVSESGSVEGTSEGNNANKDICRSNSDEDDEDCSDSDDPPRFQKQNPKSVKTRPHAKRKNNILHKENGFENEKNQPKPKSNHGVIKKLKSTPPVEDIAQPTVSDKNNSEAISETPITSKLSVESAPRNFDLNMDLNQSLERNPEGTSLNCDRVKNEDEDKSLLTANGDYSRKESSNGIEIVNGVEDGLEISAAEGMLSCKPQVSLTSKFQGCGSFGDEDDYDADD